MNKLLLEYYPQYNDNKLDDNSSTTMYSDPTRLTYALPNSPDSCVSTKTPLSPSTALCNMDMPSLITSSSSLSVSTNTPAVSITTSASNYLANNHTASSFYSSFFGTNDTEPHLFQYRQTQHLSPNNYSHDQDNQPQHPRKKQRRHIPSSTTVTSKQPDNSPTSCPATLPTLTPLPINKTSRYTTKGIDNDPSYKDKSATQSSVSLDITPQQEQSIPENEERDLNNGGNNTTEIRRQIHIQSEQKRRAQIKCGFEELRNELPVCLNKKMSKVALLHRTVQHIQHLKSTQITILTELERLVQENEQLKRFQQSVLQTQVMDGIYPLQ